MQPSCKGHSSCSNPRKSRGRGRQEDQGSHAHHHTPALRALAARDLAQASAGRCGGFHKTKLFSPLGEPSSDTTVKDASSTEVSCARCALGRAIVAEQHKNWGEDPWRAHNRRSRRSTARQPCAGITHTVSLHYTHGHGHTDTDTYTQTHTDRQTHGHAHGVGKMERR